VPSADRRPNPAPKHDQRIDARADPHYDTQITFRYRFNWMRQPMQANMRDQQD
jgi:hypothetical protein